MEPSELLTAATGTGDLAAALGWIDEGHPVSEDFTLQQILRAVLHVERTRNSDGAIARLVRLAATSGIDTSQMLFGVDQITPPATYRRALDALAWKSPTRTLEGLDSTSVHAAQREEPDVIETMCAVGGLSYRELRDRAACTLPNDPAGPWTPAQIDEVFAVIDAIISGPGDTDLPGASPTRPLEHVLELPGGLSGWAAVEAMRVGGTPFELLLTQRAVGGSWLQHRNRHSSAPSRSVIDGVAQELDSRNINFRVEGGTSDYAMSPARLRRLIGSDLPVKLVVLDSSGNGAYGVIVSVANDGGTARKNSGALLPAPLPQVPVACVLAGAGWADRNEIRHLAELLDGRIFSDRHVTALVDDVAQTLESDDNGDDS